MFHAIITLAAGPNIQPNDNGLPGVSALENMVGALLTFGIIASVAGLVLSAIAWAVGHHSANPHVANRGKTGVIASLVAAILIGGADALVTFFLGVGSGL